MIVSLELRLTINRDLLEKQISYIENEANNHISDIHQHEILNGIQLLLIEIANQVADTVEGEVVDNG